MLKRGRSRDKMHSGDFDKTREKGVATKIAHLSPRWCARTEEMRGERESESNRRKQDNEIDALTYLQWFVQDPSAFCL